MNGRPNIVLVHGAWADGSCWSGVIERLQADGFEVRAPQFPLSTLDADVARLRQVLGFLEGPTIVVGHSYGGQILTALGPDASNVLGLVYISAFGLDEGESLESLSKQGAPSPGSASIKPDDKGYLWINRSTFHTSFCADATNDEAAVMAAVCSSPGRVGPDMPAGNGMRGRLIPRILRRRRIHRHRRIHCRGRIQLLRRSNHA